MPKRFDQKQCFDEIMREDRTKWHVNTATLRALGDSESGTDLGPYARGASKVQGGALIPVC